MESSELNKIDEGSAEVMLNEEINNLIEKAKKEEWEEIDAKINADNFCDFPQVLEWTDKGLDDEEEGVRDLAASILELSSGDLSDKQKEKLEGNMARNEGGFDEFRAACALANHGGKSADIEKKLEEFVDNPDTKEIAEKYLKMIRGQ